jgi:hypothetical protein
VNFGNAPRSRRKLSARFSYAINYGCKRVTFYCFFRSVMRR